MSESCEAVRILILNGDLPIFPGRAGHEYLHTTLLAQRAHKVGLVSMVHTSRAAREKTRFGPCWCRALPVGKSPFTVNPLPIRLRRQLGHGVSGRRYIPHGVRGSRGPKTRPSRICSSPTWLSQCCERSRMAAGRHSSWSRASVPTGWTLYRVFR